MSIYIYQAPGAETPSTAFIGESVDIRSVIPEGVDYIEVSENQWKQLQPAYPFWALDFKKKTVTIDTAAQEKGAKDQFNVGIDAELLEIDQKKIRAMSDFIITGDKTRVEALEAHAVLLRQQRRN